MLVNFKSKCPVNELLYGGITRSGDGNMSGRFSNRDELSLEYVLVSMV